MNEISYKKSGRCWIILVLCCLACAVGFGGGMTCMSLFVASLVAQFQSPVTSVTLFFTIATLVSIPALIVVPRLIKKNTAVTAGVCGVLAGASYIAIAMAPSLPMLYLAAVVFGLTYPFATTMLAGIIIPNWFYKNQGLFIGVSLACTGIGGAVLSPVFTSLIASAGWQTALLTLGVAIVVVCGLGSFAFARFSPLPLGLLPYGATENDVKAIEGAGGEKTTAATEGLAYKDFVKSPAFFGLAISLLLVGLVACINQQLNTVAQMSGFDPAVAGLFVSVISIGAMIGKIVLGRVSDRFGGPATGFSGAVLAAIGFVCLLVGISGANEIAMYAGALFCGLGTCLGTLAGPLFTMSAVGPREYATIIGTTSVFLTLGNAVAAPIVSGIFDTTGSYFGSLVLLLVLTVVFAPLAALSIKGARKKWAFGSASEGSKVMEAA